MTSSTPVDDNITTGNVILRARKYASLEECDAVMYRWMDGEPKTYKMTYLSLLEMSEEKWGNIWKEHVKFRDMTLKKIQFEYDEHHFEYTNQSVRCNLRATEDYIEHMNSKLRLIMLERRLQKMENKL